jgi:3,4-dihydroxy 2-butanone 4-phosphate synthase/GTP cyclohydrolase II
MSAIFDVSKIVDEFEGSRKDAHFPFVTLSYAQSIDGSIATRQRTPLALSGAASMRMTHELRAVHDAILVGIGTIIADNPQLTVRLVPGDNPQPVIVDSALRFPLESKLLKSQNNPWIATTYLKTGTREHALREAGCRILKFKPNDQGKVPLADLLSTLRRAGIQRVMVEGGASVITSILEQKLVNLVIITIAPLFVGGLHSISSDMTASHELEAPTYTQLDRDLVVWGKLA